MIETIDSLRQHQLVILRRLREHPLTEFELAREVADHSGHTPETTEEKMADWLEELRLEGLIWSGSLTNANNQQIMAAALTKRGVDLIA